MTLAPDLRQAAAPPAPPPGAAVPAISLSGLTAQYRGADRPSVDRLTLAVAPGVIFGLLGPNGSGKTTTINLVTGFMTPGRGTARVFGHAPGSEQAKQLMGVVTQETALYDRLSARDNLSLYAALYKIPRRERPGRVEQALRLADLAGVAGKKAGTFSGGMARRLQIARALLHAPQLVILDEPTLGVDPVQRAVLWDHIRALRDAGKTVLLTTNLMEEAAALCDQLAIMRDGRLAAPVDTPQNLRGGRGTVVTVTADGTEPGMSQACEALRADPGVTGVTVTRGARPGRYRLEVTASAADGATGQVVMHLAGRGAVIRDVSSRTATLDEVFLALTGGFPAAR